MQEGYLLDSNILLRLAWLQDKDSEMVAAAYETLQRRGTPLFFTLQNASEFWNTCTRPAGANGLDLPPEQAHEALLEIQRFVTMLPDSAEVYEHWRTLVYAHKVIGRQAHDAKLVASMLTHGVPRILTLNVSDFVRYNAVQVIHPSEVQ